MCIAKAKPAKYLSRLVQGSAAIGGVQVMTHLQHVPLAGGQCQCTPGLRAPVESIEWLNHMAGLADPAVEG